MRILRVSCFYPDAAAALMTMVSLSRRREASGG
jgi:hypothetical protein